MQEIALVCQNAMQSADDALLALQSNRYSVNTPSRTELEMPIFNVCYTFIDLNSFVTKQFDYVMKKGNPSPETLRHWDHLIKHAAPAPQTLMVRSEVAYLGGVSLFTASYGDDDYLPYGSGDFWGYNGPTKLNEKCECGVTITMGKDETPEMHSSYCPIYKKWLKEKK
jgi:hypothetical protein